jgi:hypothetical protein
VDSNARIFFFPPEILIARESFIDSIAEVRLAT